MRLTELEPKWANPELFHFLCPHCKSVILTCKTRPMGRKEQRGILKMEFGENGAPLPVVQTNPETAWSVSAPSFDTMSITPSIDASASGHWHGHITNGEIVGGI